MARRYRVELDNLPLEDLLQQLQLEGDLAGRMGLAGGGPPVTVTRVEVEPAARTWRFVLRGEAAGTAGSNGAAAVPGALPPDLSRKVAARLPGAEVVSFVWEADPEEEDERRYMEGLLRGGGPAARSASLPLPSREGSDGRSPRSGGGGGRRRPGWGGAARPPGNEPVPLDDLEEREGEQVSVRGQVIWRQERELRSGRRVLRLDLTDFSDSLSVRLFPPAGAEGEGGAWAAAPGTWVRAWGRLERDRVTGELELVAEGVAVEPPPGSADTAPEKRVELHLHTKMSAMDAVTDVDELVALAAAWGHEAVAITDHGVVQAFPEAARAGRKHGVKILFGLEGYLVDDPSESADDGRPRYYHIILLARNARGLRNLYRLVSLSHLEFFHRVPRIPRAALEQHREGLVVGSACERGELFRAVLEGRPREELARIARFYDYLEIQPRSNNSFLIREGRVRDLDALAALNRRIYELGCELGKPVVATGDVHFLRPQDQIFRQIILAARGFADVERPTPLYFRTTGEMLEEFAYLGEAAARQVVIENPRRIAASIEALSPIPEGLHTPRIPGAAAFIGELARQRARELYGDPLPEPVASRLEQELRAIVDGGYAAVYWIAHKLVRKSVEAGFLVGSRGSVGSSLVATLCGITEVNPLPPHYRCPRCRYTRFENQEGEHGEGARGRAQVGVDLPPRECPRCGAPLAREGFDIPFEVFMGFRGEKVPDIDLNVSGEVQGMIHRYAEELFGREHVYRAGTISTLADRTAYGFVKKFLEEQGRSARQAEVNRLVRGIAGCKRTTGQHPGGVMIVPEGREIYEFTPIQYPANDRSAGVVTTHLDYHAIHDNLVKVDILGHDDPTMLRLLQELTGVDPATIPLDDPATLSIFSGLDALGLRPEQIGTTVGTLGIPEFGTRFVRQMLEETRPRTFAELVRISGLSHGTNVWTNNAQELVARGVASLSEVIATRDDIMVFLVRQGLEPELAFAIMERVRKGKGLEPAQEAAMRGAGVPEWYIASCNKITYMFPKAHAVAYVTMAFRIAYFKVHHPGAFYAAHFSVRAPDLDISLLLGGMEAIRRRIDELEAKGATASPKERELVPLLEVALEAAARGFAFLPVDLYRSHPKRFQILPEGLLPPLVSIGGLGDVAAEALARAREEAPFRSVDDLRQRARLPRSVVDLLRSAGVLDGLPDNDQLALF